MTDTADTAAPRTPVQAAERSYIERTAPKKKELTDEQLAAKAASRRAKKTRQKERRAKEAGERAASEAERAEGACGTVHAGARPQVRWPRVSRACLACRATRQVIGLPPAKLGYSNGQTARLRR